MPSRALALMLLFAATPPLVYPQQAENPKPDTLLVLKNGAEVRGVFIELKDGQYSLRLTDGRVMTYPATDVEKMQRIPGAEPTTATPTVQTAPAQTSPFVCRTFITEKDVDKALYVFVETIKAKKQWYGSSGIIWDKIAEKAREMGADAVINFHTWHSPSGWGWATPHGEGMAVKWTEAGRKALPSLEGRCY